MCVCRPITFLPVPWVQVNDVSGGRHDPAMLATVAALDVPYVLMHMRGTPQTMQSPALTAYGDVVAEVAHEINAQLDVADRLLPRWLQVSTRRFARLPAARPPVIPPSFASLPGVILTQVVDPGIGFAKGEAENLKLLKPNNLRRLRALVGDRVLFVGTSRKRFLGNIVDHRDASLRDGPDGPTAGGGAKAMTPERVADLDWATTATTCLSAAAGAQILRVHNVKAARRACDVLTAVANSPP